MSSNKQKNTRSEMIVREIMEEARSLYEEKISQIATIEAQAVLVHNESMKQLYENIALDARVEPHHIASGSVVTNKLMSNVRGHVHELLSEIAQEENQIAEKYIRKVKTLLADAIHSLYKKEGKEGDNGHDNGQQASQPID